MRELRQGVWRRPGGMPAQKAEVDGGEKPFSSHLLWAILASVFGFVPLGLVSVVYAVLARSRFEAGDHEGALREAAHALYWIFVSFLLALVIIPIAILLLGLILHGWGH